MAIHTMRDFENEINRKGYEISMVLDANYTSDHKIKRITILSAYKDEFGRTCFYKWNEDGKCTSRNGDRSFPELNLFEL